MHRLPRSPLASLLPLAALGLAACSGGAPGGQARLALAAAAAPAAAADGATQAVALPGGVTVTEIKLVVRKLKLEGTLAAGAAVTPAAALHDGGDDGLTEVEHESDDASEPVLGPCVVDLSGAALDGGVTPVCAGLVPDGTFRELKLAIGPSADVTDPDLAGGASVLVRGTVADAGGTADFTFTSALTVEVDLEGRFAVDAAAGNGLTLRVDPSTWFGSAAAPLDPRDPASASAIENAIAHALDAFEDDDGDGADDHGGQGEGEPGSGGSGGSGGGEGAGHG